MNRLFLLGFLLASFARAQVYEWQDVPYTTRVDVASVAGPRVVSVNGSTGVVTVTADLLGAVSTNGTSLMTPTSEIRSAGFNGEVDGYAIGSSGFTSRSGDVVLNVYQDGFSFQNSVAEVQLGADGLIINDPAGGSWNMYGTVLRSGNDSWLMDRDGGGSWTVASTADITNTVSALAPTNNPAFTGTLTATGVVASTVRAATSAGGSLNAVGGAPCLTWGAGGGCNVTTTDGLTVGGTLSVSGALTVNSYPGAALITNYLSAAGMTTGTVWQIGGGSVTNFFSRSGACVPQTGQTNTYVVGDDGYYQSGVANAMPRFSIVGIAGTAETNQVRDNTTGLIWARSANLGNLSWSNAIATVEALDYGGATDWRLPNVRELLSVVSYQHAGPALTAGSGADKWTAAAGPFFGVQNDAYWTSTTYMVSPTYAHYVNLHGGFAYYGMKTSSLFVWAVRGGN